MKRLSMDIRENDSSMNITTIRSAKPNFRKLTRKETISSIRELMDVKKVNGS